jgi:GNAT superfamily N-acetyltransferase
MDAVITAIPPRRYCICRQACYRLTHRPAAGATVSDQDLFDTLRIAWADSDDEILACLALMRRWWPHLERHGALVARVRSLQQDGYRLAAAWQDDRVVCCAGYRLAENLLRGRYLHVDELVTAEDVRSTGIGQRLLQVLIEEAHNLDCQALVLECGLGNARAHAFYFREGLHISALRFTVDFFPVFGNE